MRTSAGKFDIAEANSRAMPISLVTNFALADIQFGHVLYRYFDIPSTAPIVPPCDAITNGSRRGPAFRHTSWCL